MKVVNHLRTKVGTYKKNYVEVVEHGMFFHMDATVIVTREYAVTVNNK